MIAIFFLPSVVNLYIFSDGLDCLFISIVFFVKPCKSDRSVYYLCHYPIFKKGEFEMSMMKTEVVVIRLTKKERALLDSIKTTPLLADWMRELALSKLSEDNTAN